VANAGFRGELLPRAATTVGDGVAFHDLLTRCGGVMPRSIKTKPAAMADGRIILKFCPIVTKPTATTPAPAAATAVTGRGKRKARDLDVAQRRGFFLHHGGGGDLDVA
jgi:hypothetical protein